MGFLVLNTLKTHADVFRAYVETTKNLPRMSHTLWKEQAEREYDAASYTMRTITGCVEFGVALWDVNLNLSS